MADSVEFTLKLIDELSRPAAQAKKSTEGVERAMRATAKAAEAVSGKGLGRGFAEIAKAAQAAQGQADKLARSMAGKQLGQGFAQIALAAKAAQQQQDASARKTVQGIAAIGKAAQAAELKAARLAQRLSDRNMGRGFAEIAKAAKAAEAESARSTRNMARGFAQIAKAAEAAQRAEQKAAMKASRAAQIAEIKKAEQALKDQKRATEEAGRASREMSAAIEGSLIGALKSLAVVGAAAAAAVAAAITYLAVRFATAAVEASAFAQKSRMALKFLTGDAEVAAREFDAVRQEAQQLGLNVETTQHSFQKLLAAQFDVGKAKEFIRMGSDLQAIGASAENVESVLLAITKIKAAGKLQGDELLMLQEAGVSMELVYDALGKRLGKTKDELLKMQAAGEIKDLDALAAIQEAVKKKTGVAEFGDAGRTFATETMAGMKAVLAARMQNTFIDIGTAIEPGLTKILGLVLGTIDKIASNPAFQNFASDMLFEFEQLVVWVEANWPAIEGIVMGAIEGITKGIRMAVSVVQWMVEHWDTLKTALKGVAIVFGAIFIAINLLMAPVYLAVGAIVAIVGAIAYVIGWLWDAVPQFAGAASAWVTSLLGKLGGFGAFLLEAGKTIAFNIITGMVGGLGGGVGLVLQAVRNLGSAIISGVRAILDINSPSRVMQDLGWFTGEGFAQGLEWQTPQVAGASAMLGGAAETGAASGVQGASAVPASAPVSGAVSTTNNNYGGFSVNVSASAGPGATKQDAERLADDLEPIIRKQFFSLLNDLAPA